MAAIASLIFPLACCVCVLVTSTTARKVTEDNMIDSIPALIERAEFHHNSLKRSLDDLDFALSILDDHQIDHKARQKRDSLAQLTQSYYAFCQTFLNSSQPAHGVTNSSAIPSNNQTNSTSQVPKGQDMRTPNSTVVPISVSVDTTSFINASIVTFKVQHTKPGIVVRGPSILDLGQMQTKQLQIDPHDSLPKISTVVFRIESHWCTEKVDEQPSVYFFFKSTIEQEILTDVFVKVCNPAAAAHRELVLHDEPDLGFESQNTTETAILPPLVKFQYNTTSPNLRVKKGENITLVLQIDTEEMMARSTSFSVLTLGYNEVSGASVSFISISPARIGQSLFYIFNSEMVFRGAPWSNMTTVEEVTKNGTKPELNYGPLNETEAEKEELRYGYVKITLDTESGTSTGSVHLMQNSYCTSGSCIVEGTGMDLTLSIRKENEDSTFPDDVVLPLHQKQQFCEKDNPDRYCGVECAVGGAFVRSLIIRKLKDSGRNTSSIESFKTQFWAKAVLKLGKYEPDMSGNYECLGVTTSGHQFRFEIELQFMKAAIIIFNASTVVVGDGENLVFTCSATGTNVTLNIIRKYDEEGIYEDYMSMDPALSRKEEREEDQVTLNLTVPMSYIEEHKYDEYICQASDSMSSDLAYFNVADVLSS